MTPFDDLTPFGLFLLGEEPTIEDFILLIGTIVAFIAFVLWCCFPIQPKESFNHQQFSCKSIQHDNSNLQQQQQNANSGSKSSNATTTYGFKLDNTNSHVTYHCCNNSSN